MKKFYRCPICGEEFCLKGRKYCEEDGDIYCTGGKSVAHTKVKMEYAGQTMNDLRKLRKKRTGE
jgi:hypothetical protein